MRFELLAWSRLHSLCWISVFLTYLATGLASVSLSVAGGGRSYVFTGTGLGRTQEIRSSVLEEMEDFSVTFWFRNVVPAAQSFFRFAGYPGAFFSFWAAVDGPSEGSGWSLTDNELYPGWEPNLPILNVINYEDGRIRLFHKESKTNVFHRDSRDDESWTFMGLSWKAATGQLSGFMWNEVDRVLVEYNTSLPEHINRPLPRGFFRIGQGEANDNTLAGEVDEFCVFNSSFPTSVVNSVLQHGCRASESSLVLQYQFDKDRSQEKKSPNIYDSVTQTFTGVSSTAVDISGSGKFITDFGGDIGPIHTVSDSPAPTGRPIFIRSTRLEDVKVQLTCIGDLCHHIRVSSLPANGVLCRRASNASRACRAEDAVSTSDMHRNATLELFYVPANLSTPGDTDGFYFRVYDLAETEFAEGYAEVLTNTPPMNFDTVVELHEGEEKIAFLPSQQWLFKELDGRSFNVSVQIMDIVAAESLEFYDCEECIDPSFTEYEAYFHYYAEPGHWIAQDNVTPLNTSETKIWLRERLRRLIIIHRKGGAYGQNLATIRFRYFDGFDFSPVSTLTVNVLPVNEAPVAEDFNITVLEESGPTLVTLLDHFSDREEDEIYATIKNFPEGIQVFTVTNELNQLLPGEELTPESSVQRLSQWVSSSKTGRAKSCWNEYHCVEQLAGPPDLYPAAVDGAGTWSSSGAGHTSQWVEVFWDEPVVATQVSLFETWSPGGVVEILAKRFGESNSSWEVVYRGNNRMAEHCPDQPKTALCAGITTYQLCPKSYMTNHLRFHLELDSPQRYIAVDAILLQGESRPRSNVITDKRGRIFIEPNRDFNGVSTLEFELSDCPYYLKVRDLPGLDSRRGEFKIRVQPVNDSPQFLIDPTGFKFEVEAYEEESGRSETVLINVSSYVSDVDGDNLTLYVTSLPDSKLGNLVHTPEQRVPISTSQLPLRLPLDSPLYFRRGPCVDLETRTTSFTIRVQDPDGGFAISKVSLVCSCKLPLRYKRQFGNGVALKTLALALFVLGFLIAAGALCFNIKYRRHPSVKMSSWRVNVSTCAGSILASASLFFFASNGEDVRSCGLSTPTETIDLQCNNETNTCCSDYGSRVCLPLISLLTVGYTLAFGSLFLRTYRVHTIFNNQSLKKINFTDIKIFKKLVVLVLVAFVFVGIWAFIFPLRGRFTKRPGSLNADLQIREAIIDESCDSPHFGSISAAFHSFLIGLLVYGSYLAYQVRNVEIVDANDSREIGVSTYNICVLGTAGYTMAKLVPTAWMSACVAMVTVFLCNSTTILCLFGPRMWRLAFGNSIPRVTPYSTRALSANQQKGHTPSNERNAAKSSAHLSNNGGSTKLVSNEVHRKP